MANTTSKHALNIHGTNPQFLIEKIIRSRIYDSMYWKEHCFALTSASIIDKTINLNSIGGTFEAQKITPFLCLLCKLLQIQPEKDILLEYLKFEEFKYLRALAAMYVRMTFKSIEVYEVLEPMLNDYRKLRYKGIDGSFSILHMDEFIDQLLTQDRVCEITLPRLTKREVLEETENLTERISLLEEALLGESDNAESKIKRRRSSSASGSESDDSFILEIKEKKLKNERLRQIRLDDLEKEEKDGMDLDKNGEDELEGYTSQEYSDDGNENREERFVSRSPSRSISPDRIVEDKNDDGRFVSKSPSRSVSPDTIEEKERFVSKSPSRSPR